MCIAKHAIVKHVIVKVRNSYQKSTIAEAVQINEEKDEMEKPHFLAQDPDHGSVFGYGSPDRMKIQKSENSVLQNLFSKSIRRNHYVQCEESKRRFILDRCK